MKLQEEYKELLIDYLSYNEIFYKNFGVFTNEKNSTELAKEIASRFYNNLVCLGNYLLTKDSLGATLIQRYNHELVIDFYYLLNPGGEKDKVEKFFNYNSKSTSRGWSSVQKKEKEKFIPPWVADGKGLTAIYRKLCDMAHPNIMSIQLNRKGPEYEYLMIKDSICFCIFEICLCFEHAPFKELFPSIDWYSNYDINLNFKDKAAHLLFLD